MKSLSSFWKLKLVRTFKIDNSVGNDTSSSIIIIIPNYAMQGCESPYDNVGDITAIMGQFSITAFNKFPRKGKLK